MSKINDLYGSVIAAYNEWQQLLVNPRFRRSNTQIGWDGPGPSMLPALMTRGVVAEMASRGEYSFQMLPDGALLQLSYSFAKDGETLERARLGYFGGTMETREELDQPDPLSLGEADDGSSEPLAVPSEDDLDAVYMPDPDEPVSWMRIDYVRSSRISVTHSPCHLQLSGFPQTRLPLTAVPSPRQFIEFVVASCYPDWYDTLRLREGIYHSVETIRNVNDHVSPCDNKHFYGLVMHLLVPGNR